MPLFHHPKGSPEARAHMARLRAMRGKNPKRPRITRSYAPLLGDPDRTAAARLQAQGHPPAGSVWVLSPTKPNTYAPMFKGTFAAAQAAALALAQHHGGAVMIFDATGGRARLKFVAQVDPGGAAPNPLTEQEHRKIMEDARWDGTRARFHKQKGEVFQHGIYAGRAARGKEIAHNYSPNPQLLVLGNPNGRGDYAPGSPLWGVVKIGRSKYRMIGRTPDGTQLWKGAGPTIYYMITRQDGAPYPIPAVPYFNRLHSSIRRHIRIQQRGGNPVATDIAVDPPHERTSRQYTLAPSAGGKDFKLRAYSGRKKVTDRFVTAADVYDRAFYFPPGGMGPGVLPRRGNPETYLKPGDIVLAQVTAQGLHQGEAYTVVGVDTQPTPFGVFVTYHVRDMAGVVFPVTNGHLLLTKSERRGNPTISDPGSMPHEKGRKFTTRSGAFIRSTGERKGVPVAVEGWDYGVPLGTMVGTHSIAYDLEAGTKPGYYPGHGIWGGPQDPSAVPRRGNPATPQAQAYIGRKIRKLRHEGYPQGQAVAAAHSMARRKGYRSVAQPNPGYGPRPAGVPAWMWADPAFHAEVRAFRRRHGPRKPIEIRAIKVPKGFPKFMSVYGHANHAVYDAPPGSNKGKRIHHFGKRGKGKPWLVSSQARGPKFLAYVGGSFKARPTWIYD